MPFALPPSSPRDKPNSQLLLAGTLLWRVHQTNRPSDSFNPRLTHKYFGGGRFDATADDIYSYTYSGLSASIPLSEVLLRDKDFNDSGRRLVRRADINNRSLSAIQVAVDLTLIDLRAGPDLAPASQNGWLSKC